jgi:thioredoxin 1
MFFITKEDELLFNNLSVLYFYASWMPYHNKMMFMIDKIEKKYENIKFQAIDVDFFKNQCLRFNIKSVPTIVILDNDKEIKRINGIVLTSAFKSVFNEICKGKYAKEI